MSRFRHPHQEEPDKPPVLQRPKRLERGLVQVYTGGGKGKSSAAFGLGLRAVGHGLRVHAVLFMKGASEFGEFRSVEWLPGFTLARFGTDKLVDMNAPSPEDVAQAESALAHGRQAMLSGEYDVIILDEVNVAAAWKLVPLEKVLQLIQEKPPGVELVLTGRYAPKQVIAAADYVTRLNMIKHPYQKGIIAREGIDY